jgi:tetratricopeptide (TPR) repeat protein
LTSAPSSEVLASRADALLRAGRYAEATDAYRLLLRVDPARPVAWYNLGYLLQSARAFDEALSCYARAVEFGIDGPEEALSNRALILAQHLHRPQEALVELEAALQKNPRYLPALVNLGTLHEQLGTRAAALAAYQAALAIDPYHPLALSRLPNVATIAAPSDPIVMRLRGALAREGGTEADRADLAFALGKALDACGAYDQAFEAYRSANEASRRSGEAHQRRGYDRQLAERFVDDLIGAFPSVAGTVSREPEGGPSPIFICGLFRSGSTLVEKILGSHSQVTAGGELDLLPALASKVLQPVLSRKGALDDAQVEALREAYRSQLAQRFGVATLVTDKRPDNFLLIGLIKRMFPEAKIVFTKRDALDNCLSLYFLHLDHSMPYALDLTDSAHWYRQHERLMAHWQRLYPGDIHTVEYDLLVKDPRPVVAGLLGHLDLPWEERCLDFHQTSAMVRTPSNWQVRQPLYTTSSGRWRHYERHLGPLKAALGGAS